MTHRLAALALTAGLLGPARAADPPATDAQAVQGTWDVVSVVRDGGKKDPNLSGGTRIHEGTKYVIRPKDGSKAEVVTGTFTFDPSSSPAHFDMTPDAGRYKGKVLRGIVRVGDGKMTIAFAEPGADRPTGFAPKPGVVVAEHTKAGAE